MPDVREGTACAHVPDELHGGLAEAVLEILVAQHLAVRPQQCLAFVLYDVRHALEVELPARTEAQDGRFTVKNQFSAAAWGRHTDMSNQPATGPPLK